MPNDFFYDPSGQRMLPITVRIKVGGQEVAYEYRISERIIFDRNALIEANDILEKAIRPTKERAEQILSDIIRDARETDMERTARIFNRTLTDCEKARRRSIENADDDNC